MKIIPVSETETNINLLVYGDPGVGKTYFTATAAEHEELRDILFVNVEGGMLSVKHREHVYMTEKVTSLAEVVQLFWQLVNDPEFERFRVIVVDSLTELQTINLEEIVTKAGRNVDEITIKDYGTSTSQMKHITRMFRDLPRHVVFTALVTREYKDDQKKKLTSVRPQLTSKLCSSVMGYMDFVWCLGTDHENNRILLTEPTGSYQIKTRGVAFAERLGAKVTNPNLAEIYNILKETENG